MLVAVCALAAVTSAHFAHIAYFEVSELNVLTLDEELARIVNGSGGMEQHENPVQADRLTLLRQEAQRVGDGLQALLSAASLAVGLTFTAVLLARVRPEMLLLPVMAVPSVLAGRRAQSVLDQAREDSAGDVRLAKHLLGLSTDPPPPKSCGCTGSPTTSGPAIVGTGPTIAAAWAMPRPGAAACGGRLRRLRPLLRWARSTSSSATPSPGGAALATWCSMVSAGRPRRAARSRPPSRSCSSCSARRGPSPGSRS